MIVMALHGEASLFQYLRIRSLILPSDVEEEAEAAKMELLQLTFVASVDSPGFTVLKEVSGHCGTVDFDLCVECNSSSLPDCLPVPPKSTAGLRNAVVDLSVDVGGAIECATQPTATAYSYCPFTMKHGSWYWLPGTG